MAKHLDSWQKSLKEIWRGNVRIEFKYIGETGTSKRQVQLTSILKAPKGILYLQGYCSLRKEERRFRLSEIVSKIKNLETGKSIIAPDFVCSLGIDEDTAYDGAK